jgi:hypothetical protein
MATRKSRSKTSSSRRPRRTARKRKPNPIASAGRRRPKRPKPGRPKRPGRPRPGPRGDDDVWVQLGPLWLQSPTFSDTWAEAGGRRPRKGHRRGTKIKAGLAVKLLKRAQKR